MKQACLKYKYLLKQITINRKKMLQLIKSAFFVKCTYCTKYEVFNEGYFQQMWRVTSWCDDLLKNSLTQNFILWVVMALKFWNPKLNLLYIIAFLLV